MPDQIIMIGQMARMLGITPYELRKKGEPVGEGQLDLRSESDKILEPYYIDEDTGYRYYTLSQYERYIEALREECY